MSGEVATGDEHKSGAQREKPADALNLETPVKAGAALAVLAYAVGVVTVAIYVHNKDIAAPDLTVFRAQYILTGGVELGLLALMAVVISVGFFLAGWAPQPLASRDRAAQRGRLYARKAGRWVVAKVCSGPAGATRTCLMGATAVWVGYLSIFKILPNPTGTRSADAALMVVLSGFFAVTIWLAFKWSAPHPEDKHPEDSSQARQPENRSGDSRQARDRAWLVIIPLTLVACGLAGAFMYLYAQKMYPRLSSQFGGGESTNAVFLFTPEGAADARQIGIPLRPHSRLSEEVRLLLTDKDFYAVHVRAGPVIEVSRSDVQSLITDSQSPRPTGIELDANFKPTPAEDVVLTFSESIAPSTVSKLWDGRHPVQLTVRTRRDRKHGTAILTSHQAALGSIIAAPGEEPTRRRQKATLSYVSASARRGSELRLMLTRQVFAGSQRDIEWHPSPRVTDVVGNHVPRGTEYEVHPEGGTPKH